VGSFPVNSCYTGPVTIADQATEAAMCSIISNHFPHHAMYVLWTYLSNRVNFIISSDLLREIEFSVFLICENLLIYTKKIMMRIGCLTSPVRTFRSATTCSLHHNPLLAMWLEVEQSERELLFFFREGRLEANSKVWQIWRGRRLDDAWRRLWLCLGVRPHWWH